MIGNIGKLKIKFVGQFLDAFFELCLKHLIAQMMTPVVPVET